MSARTSHLRLVGASGTADPPDGLPHARPLRDRITSRHLVMLLVLLAALVAGAFLLANRPATNAAIAHSSAITATELEDRYGVKVEVVGLLANGGLIELRFQVTDADKATQLFGPVDEMPVLAVEGTGRVLRSAKGMKHTNLELLDGAAYFFLYTNAGDAVHEGSEVAFVVNGVRLPHLVVQQ